MVGIIVAGMTGFVTGYGTALYGPDVFGLRERKFRNWLKDGGPSGKDTVTKGYGSVVIMTTPGDARVVSKAPFARSTEVSSGVHELKLPRGGGFDNAPKHLEGPIGHFVAGGSNQSCWAALSAQMDVGDPVSKAGLEKTDWLSATDKRTLIKLIEAEAKAIA